MSRILAVVVWWRSGTDECVHWQQSRNTLVLILIKPLFCAPVHHKAAALQQLLWGLICLSQLPTIRLVMFFFLVLLLVFDQRQKLSGQESIQVYLRCGLGFDRAAQERQVQKPVCNYCKLFFFLILFITYLQMNLLCVPPQKRVFYACSCYGPVLLSDLISADSKSISEKSRAAAPNTFHLMMLELDNGNS